MYKMVTQLVKKFGIYGYAIIDIALKFIAYITIPIFASLMSPDEYGQYYLMLSYAAIISVFLNLNISAGTVLFKKRDGFIDTKVQYVTLIFGTLFFLLVIMMISVVVDINISFLMIVVFVAFFQALFNCILEKERAFENVNGYSIIKATMNLTTIAFSIVMIKNFSGNKFILRSEGLIIAMSVTTIFFIKRSIVKSEKKRLDALKKYLGYSIPLIPFALSSTLLVYFDRIVLDMYRPQYELGLYSFSYNIALVVNMLALGLNKSLQPQIYYYLKVSDKDSIYLNLKRYNIAFLLALVFFLLILPGGLNIMDLEGYSSSLDVIVIIIASYSLIFYYAINSNFIYYTGKSKIISYITLGAALINLVLNIVFIPKYGYAAAAITTYISYLILVLVTIIIACVINKEKSIKEVSIKYLLLSQALIIIIWRWIYAFY